MSYHNNEQQQQHQQQQQRRRRLRLYYYNLQSITTTRLGGEIDFDKLAIAVICIPCFVFVISSIYRHMVSITASSSSSEDELGFNRMIILTLTSSNAATTNKVMSHIANSFGMMAMVAISFLLLPVSRHGPITKLFGCNAARIVRLHIWTGRIIVIGSMLHGIIHLLRWKFILKESLYTLFIPPLQCWQQQHQQTQQYQPTCVDTNNTTDCSCFARFQNLAGAIACASLVLIAITSLNIIRRKLYSLFYMSHIMAAPICFLALVAHYNKGILYIIPSLLYYIASSFPSLIEYYIVNNNNNKSGVKIVSIERLETSSTKTTTSTKKMSSTQPCIISLTMEASKAAMEQYCPGTYLRLSAPQISNVAHPFSVNKVPEKENQIRIIFRAMGPFTNQLANQLCSSLSLLPTIHLDGYHGSPNRVQQVLSHDVVIMVAGGIGITPYLSLLHDIKTFLMAGNIKTNSNPTKLVLHWMCRDESLIDYINQEYFQPLLWTNNNNNQESHQQLPLLHLFDLSINIYRTGDMNDRIKSNDLGHHHDNNIIKSVYHQDNSSNNNNNNDDDDDKHTCHISTVNVGIPFTPSKFVLPMTSSLTSSSTTTTTKNTRAQRRINLWPFITYSTIVWFGLWLVWYLYLNNIHHQTKNNQIQLRVYAILTVVVFGIVIAVMYNMIITMASWYERYTNPCSCSAITKNNQNNNNINDKSMTDDCCECCCTKGATETDKLLSNEKIKKYSEQRNHSTFSMTSSSSSSFGSSFCDEENQHRNISNGVMSEINEFIGRPCINDEFFLEQTKDATCPGVFVVAHQC